MTPTLLQRVTLRAAHLLLRCWPASFRQHYGDAMLDTLHDQLRADGHHTAARRVTAAARSLAVLAAHGLLERIQSPTDSPRAPRSAMFSWQDIRYSLRLLMKTPLFTLLTVAVLAGGLGLSIFTFIFLYTAVLKPLPLPEGDRVVRMMADPGPTGNIDAQNLAVMRQSITTLTDVGAYLTQSLMAGTGEQSRAIDATTTEWNLFAAARIRPMLGRTLREEDQALGAEPVIVLGYHIWKAVYGGDSSIVGRMVPLSGVPTRVIGVMPAGFGFPVASDAWTPIQAGLLRATTPNQDYLMVYARLAPGITRQRAEAELGALLRHAREGQAVPPLRAAPTGIVLASFPMAQIGEEAPLVIGVLNTLAALILLLACINVTNLLLARANERSRETAVRLALGAPRGRLIMQSMWESILLCLAGGALATVGVAWGLEAINGWAGSHLEGNLAFWWVWHFDRTVIFAAGGFVTLAIAALGSVVARRAASAEISAVLHEGAARSGSRREGRTARALVVTQVATVSVLMFFGAMSAMIAYRAANVDLGYVTHRLLRGGVDLPPDRYPDVASRRDFLQRLSQQLRAAPSIDSVMLRIPIADMQSPDGVFELADIASKPQGRAYVQAIAGSQVTLGIGLRSGRYLDDRDDESSVPTAVVSAALAARTWPGVSPVGRQIRLKWSDDSMVIRTVVGVVGDVLLGNPLSRDRSPMAVYIPMRQTDASGAFVFFRHRGSAVAAEAAFHETVRALDPLLVTDAVTTFEEMLAKSTMIAKGVTTLFAGCFGFALLLAVSGTYGLMARSIGRRTREIGVRRALGATDQNILVMLLGQGGRQLGVGAAAALPLTLLVGWGFAHYFPIAPLTAAVTAVLVSLSITAVVLLATWLPTRQAMAVTPRDALWRD